VAGDLVNVREFPSSFQRRGHCCVFAGARHSRSLSNQERRMAGDVVDRRRVLESRRLLDAPVRRTSLPQFQLETAADRITPAT
jgi:hypothetical protein